MISDGNTNTYIQTDIQLKALRDRASGSANPMLKALRDTGFC